MKKVKPMQLWESKDNGEIIYVWREYKGKFVVIKENEHMGYFSESAIQEQYELQGSIGVIESSIDYVSIYE